MCCPSPHWLHHCSTHHSSDLGSGHQQEQTLKLRRSLSAAPFVSRLQGCRVELFGLSSAKRRRAVRRALRVGTCWAPASSCRRLRPAPQMPWQPRQLRRGSERQVLDASCVATLNVTAGTELQSLGCSRCCAACCHGGCPGETGSSCRQWGGPLRHIRHASPGGAQLLPCAPQGEWRGGAAAGRAAAAEFRVRVPRGAAHPCALVRDAGVPPGRSSPCVLNHQRLAS